jgi:hypothetical protein
MGMVKPRMAAPITPPVMPPSRHKATRNFPSQIRHTRATTAPLPRPRSILGRERDVHFDIAGGSRIPKIGERRARSVRELREAGVGIDRVLAGWDAR